MIKQIAMITALFCAFATTAAAQELVFSMEATDACIAGTPPEGAAQTCIGASANTCMETTEGGYSTVGTSGCMGAERDQWDARLNVAYRILRAAETAEDADMAELGSAVLNQAMALKEMQRAWIRFRDARCEYIGTQWGGGTGTGPAVVGCQMVMTGKQTLFLQRMMREY